MHFMKLQTQTFIRIFLILLFAASPLLVSNISFAKKYQETVQQQDQNTLVMQGFGPETHIYYTIFSAANLIAEGQSKTDRNGGLVLQYQAPKKINQGVHIYDFKIAKDGKHANLLLRHHLPTRKITIQGSGLEKFSKVSIVTPTKTSITRTDWTGAFADTETLAVDENNNGYEIALHGFSNLGDMGQKQSPAIIKVLQAPGGGLYTDTPNDLGNMTPSPPSSGLYDLSTSTLDPIAADIEAIVNNYIRALMLMTEQLSAVVIHQTLSIGQFFDAKIQLEVQRTHQKLKAEAVKDYHPSEQMCRYGSYVRSLAKTEQKANIDKYALNDVMMERYKGHRDSSGITPDQDIEARLKQYREVFCNPKDNNNGLGYMCEHDQDDVLENSTPLAAPPDGMGGQYGIAVFRDPETEVFVTRFNKDVNFTRTLDFPNTIYVDMSDGVDATDEEDVIALAKNLYWPTPMNYGSDSRALNKQRIGWMGAQRAVALANIAHNSYTNLVSMKARSVTPPEEFLTGWMFMKTMMRDFGITDPEIEQLIGIEPSYWAQMEFLTKKIYQLPHFYTNLYDKPANVERIGVTLDAIRLMQMRDYYDSNLRHEMLNSALLETELVRGNHYSQAESDLLFR